MGGRGKVKRVKGSYVERDRHGKFKNWTRIHRSIAVDAVWKAPQKTKKTGYGHRQDYYD